MYKLIRCFAKKKSNKILMLKNISALVPIFETKMHGFNVTKQKVESDFKSNNNLRKQVKILRKFQE